MYVLISHDYDLTILGSTFKIGTNLTVSDGKKPFVSLHQVKIDLNLNSISLNYLSNLF